MGCLQLPILLAVDEPIGGSRGYCTLVSRAFPESSLESLSSYLHRARTGLKNWWQVRERATKKKGGGCALDWDNNSVHATKLASFLKINHKPPSGRQDKTKTNKNNPIALTGIAKCLNGKYALAVHGLLWSWFDWFWFDFISAFFKEQYKYKDIFWHTK